MVRKLTKKQIRELNNPRQVYETRGTQLKNEAPPPNEDDQPIPRSLTRLIELKNRIKSKKGPKTVGKKCKTEENSNFKQFPGETERAFLYRINKICETVKKEAAFEQKYKVVIKQSGNEQIVVKRPKDEVELMLEQIKKDKKKKNGKETLGKSAKRKLKLAEKKKKQLMKINEKNEERNLGTIQKGQNKKSAIVDKGLSNYNNEQAHAPPVFTTLPRKVGGNSNKAISKLVAENSQNPDKILNKTIDKKGKRKNLPNALRRQLEKNQQEIIQAYKLLKSKVGNK